MIEILIKEEQLCDFKVLRCYVNGEKEPLIEYALDPNLDGQEKPNALEFLIDHAKEYIVGATNQEIEEIKNQHIIWE